MNRSCSGCEERLIRRDWIWSNVNYSVRATLSHVAISSQICYTHVVFAFIDNSNTDTYFAPKPFRHISSSSVIPKIAWQIGLDVVSSVWREYSEPPLEKLQDFDSHPQQCYPKLLWYSCRWFTSLRWLSWLSSLYPRAIAPSCALYSIYISSACPNRNDSNILLPRSQTPSTPPVRMFPAVEKWDERCLIVSRRASVFSKRSDGGWAEVHCHHVMIADSWVIRAVDAKEILWLLAIRQGRRGRLIHSNYSNRGMLEVSLLALGRRNNVEMDSALLEPHWLQWETSCDTMKM